MNLIIRDELLEPPTDLYSFRDVTLFATVFLKLDVVVETENKDGYWNFLRKRACHDFVKAMVAYDEERGFRMSTSNANLIVGAICPENLQFILSSLPRH